MLITTTTTAESESYRRRLLPPPARCPSDCRVGPTPEELSDPTTFVHWGYNENYNSNHSNSNYSNGRKRKHRYADGNADGNTDADADADADDDGSKGSKSSFRTAIDIFLSSGCCAIEDPICLPPSFVRTCLDRAGTDHRFLEGLLEREREQILAALGGGGGGSFCFGDHHRLAALTRQDYSEWVARDGGRVDVRYKLHQYPYNCGGLIYNPIVFPLVRALLNGGGDGDGESGRTDENNDDKNEAVQLLYAGIMWGMPVDKNKNAKDDDDDDDDDDQHQHWHADGGHLFADHNHHHLLPPGLTLPPHCINVFYPLVDLTRDNGPTEFRIGSHRRDRIIDTTTTTTTTTTTATNGDTAAATATAVQAKVQAKVEFPLLCPAGGAVLFDYRIQHRGRANRAVTGNTGNGNDSNGTNKNGSSNNNNNNKTSSNNDHHNNINTNGSNGNVAKANGKHKAVDNGDDDDDEADHRRPVLYLAYAKTYFRDHGNTRSGRRLDPSSRPWTTRTLEGNPVPYGKGFDRCDYDDDSSNNNNSSSSSSSSSNNASNARDRTESSNPQAGPGTAATAPGECIATADAGVGERWVLFQMTLELPDGTSSILRVISGDVPVEVAQQFCFRHGLSDDFVPVLAQTIEEQMKESATIV